MYGNASNASRFIWDPGKQTTDNVFCKTNHFIYGLKKKKKHWNFPVLFCCQRQRAAEKNNQPESVQKWRRCKTICDRTFQKTKRAAASTEFLWIPSSYFYAFADEDGVNMIRKFNPFYHSPYVWLSNSKKQRNVRKL